MQGPISMEKNLGMAAHTCHPSKGGKHKISWLKKNKKHISKIT
jgi:hypothetical protein